MTSPNQPDYTDREELRKKIAEKIWSKLGHALDSNDVAAEILPLFDHYADQRVREARIDELERLWPSITVDGYFTVDGERIKDRLATLNNTEDK